MAVEKESSLERGVVKFFIEDKGFGFITFDGVDYFAHISNVANRQSLEKGDFVDFIPQDFEKGPKAVNITKVKSNDEKEA